MTAVNMTITQTTLYAEALSNIRQVSIVATLPTPADAFTTAKLIKKHQEGVCFELSHNYTKTSIELPGLVDSSSALQHPHHGRTELSWRLPVSTSAAKAEGLGFSYVTQGWSAKGLRLDVNLSCKQCSEVIVAEGIVAAWKDLPSENWAEMMEFWHCHKPDDKPDHGDIAGTGSGVEHANHVHGEDKNVNRAYGANSRFAARHGIGFIDILSFLLVEEDCQNIVVRTTIYFFSIFLYTC